MSIKFDMSQLVDGLSGFETRAQAAIRMYVDTSAIKLQNSARQNARWTDRTGHARQRLTADAITASPGYKIRLAHGVDYGKWLELANEKRFAIIQETIGTVGMTEIVPGLENLLERLK